ncbi:hypothetical protein [Baaleninema simplex]|nr:hypothetical protein [Baaleninema simplex]
MGNPVHELPANAPTHHNIKPPDFCTGVLDKKTTLVLSYLSAALSQLAIA